ncbi:hypothetical protein L593_03615 [Salinarchaeum sp. Harcht-Bsk1]|uniref:DUF7546 family protein n=1 Tax=Salinarchaeum sp. Harcht-Bsk1 TaxID=1333523 RepID=UPI0003424628|nr:hypothetical protein [Salinarchaeum sp. Harcht-Bsk1]AGN00674.1 hypothetical protein L593_03615 [Salinarchaeum sp. Harcht-Bsk1]
MNVERLRRYEPEPREVTALAALLFAEAALLVGYLQTTQATVTAPRYLVYPFAWINAGVLAIWIVRRRRVSRPSNDAQPPGASRRRIAGVGVAVGYFLALTWIGGAIAFGDVSGVTVHWDLPPGWGPMVIAGLGPIRIAPIPYRIFGYGVLAYLIYVAALDAEATPLSAIVGVFSCVSCTLPVLALILSSTVGGAAGAAASTAYSYDLAVLVYLAALGLLTWRPDVTLLRWLR